MVLSTAVVSSVHWRLTFTSCSNSRKIRTRGCVRSTQLQCTLIADCLASILQRRYLRTYVCSTTILRDPRRRLQYSTTGIQAARKTHAVICRGSVPSRGRHALFLPRKYSEPSPLNLNTFFKAKPKPNNSNTMHALRVPKFTVEPTEYKNSSSGDYTVHH